VANLYLAAFLVLAVLDWVAVATNSRPLEYVAKPGALCALIAWAATGDAAWPWLIAALSFSLVGDVLLMLPADAFAPGLGAFLIAHLAYIVAFTAPLPARIGWLLVVLAASYPITARLLRAVPTGPLRPAVAIYMAAIALMVGSAIASGDAVATMGAALFLASDTMLGWDRFVQRQPWARPAVMVTYHLGQLALAAALRSH
jgi:uncharacterized membrane protein YhhN